MIILVTGDLLEADADALVNPVNTVGIMGKGIALQFKDAFPHNYKVYRDACKNGQLHTGDILAVKDSNPILGEKVIINLPTKQHWKQRSEYDYIEAGVKSLASYIKENHIKSVAVPPLGCGNGGLDWNRVKPIIERNLSSSLADILVYEPNAAVKDLLQKQSTTSRAELTPGRAMLLFVLFHYEALGEHASLFSANKLAYFLQRMGENLRLEFKAYLFGPYSEDVKRVLRALNGTYLNGLEQNQAKAFEPLKLNYEKYNDVRQYIDAKLSSDQKQRLKTLITFISGFESELSLEVLSSVSMILDKSPGLSLQKVTEQCKWNTRKTRLFKDEYVKIAYDHLRNTLYKN